MEKLFKRISADRFTTSLKESQVKMISSPFYWFQEKNGRFIFTVADCTGHGVPRAMVSVMCNNGLNRSVKKIDLEDSRLILDKTRKIVIEEFEKSHKEVKDGMDIALVS